MADVPKPEVRTCSGGVEAYLEKVRGWKAIPIEEALSCDLREKVIALCAATPRWGRGV